MKKRRVLVLCGGISAERRVSLVSAKTVFDALDAKRYDKALIYIDPNGRWLKGDPKKLPSKVPQRELAVGSGKSLEPFALLGGAGAPDAVFPVLHGPFGEDGTMQGFLELAGAAYVGCGVLASSAGMDKDTSKRLSVQAGLPVIPYGTLNDPELASALAERLGYPVFVKPARMGSSVGVVKARSASELAAAVREALRYDDKILIEKGIPAREIETAVLGDPWSLEPSDPLAAKASVVGEIVPNAEFYDYKAKYLDPNGAKLLIPAPITPAQAERVRELAVQAFRAHDAYGLARVDFLMNKEDGALYLNEINTLPGFTGASMYPLLWRETGLSTPKLVDALVELAIRRSKRRAKLAAAP